MTPETRQRALAKLDKFTPKIGYPTKWRDYSALVIDRDDLFGNYRRGLRRRATTANWPSSAARSTATSGS